MKIPETVIISGVPYSISIVEPNDLDAVYTGRLDYSQLHMTIKNCHPESMKLTFLHEVVHGMMTAAGEQSGEHDEKLVDGLAHQLYLFIKDNPEIFKGE